MLEPKKLSSLSVVSLKDRNTEEDILVPALRVVPGTEGNTPPTYENILVNVKDIVPVSAGASTAPGVYTTVYSNWTTITAQMFAAGRNVVKVFYEAANQQEEYGLILADDVPKGSEVWVDITNDSGTVVFKLDSGDELYRDIEASGIYIFIKMDEFPGERSWFYTASPDTGEDLPVA